MTVEQGAVVFENEGFQEPSTAYEEARRGAYDPTYLLHAGQAADLQTSRGLLQGQGSGLQVGDVSQRLRAAGRAPDQANSAHSTSWRRGPASETK